MDTVALRTQSGRYCPVLGFACPQLGRPFTGREGLKKNTGWRVAVGATLVVALAWISHHFLGQPEEGRG
jgi:hypothetical protein